MAPSIVDTSTAATAPAQPLKGVSDYKEAYGVAAGPKRYNADVELHGSATQPKASYPNYLPTWDFSVTYPPLTDFEYYEHGKDADPKFPDLLRGATVEAITGTIGVDVHGTQLSELSDKGKDQLALFVAKHKVVAFRGQDFADMPIADAVEFGRYFGRLHIHPTSPAPVGHPEIHIVHRNADDTSAMNFFDDRLSSLAWHTDISYERQPPGTTFLYVLDGPSGGGDTVFSNQALAYQRLSPLMQERLHGLKAIHVGAEQANASSGAGGVVRREAVNSVHPVIRTHPGTGEKALYVNPQFTRRIIGLKKEESDMLLKFLFDHIAYSQDIQVRVKWAPKTVVVWDNRLVAHSAILDWQNGQRRHIARITPQAEAPYETPFHS